MTGLVDGGQLHLKLPREIPREVPQRAQFFILSDTREVIDSWRID